MLVIRGGCLVESGGGRSFGKVEQLGKPRRVAPRVVFENLSSEEQLERTFFGQHLDVVDGRIAGWRSRHPKRRDNTVLTVTS